MMQRYRHGLPLILMLAAMLVGSRPARAQTAPDARWNDWLGCWSLVADGARAAIPAEDAATGAGRARARVNRSARVCVTRAQAGVELQTSVADQPVLSQTVIADGRDHPIAEAGCTGTQRAQWSADGLRLFSKAELSCGAEPTRAVSGLALIGTDGQWIDAQAVTIAGRESVRVRRFRPAEDRARSTPPAAAARLSIDAITEASGVVSPAVIEAALLETNTRFRLSSKVLRDLDRAGVADSVTDLMVALSYPGAFAIRPTAPVDRLAPLPLGADFLDASFEYSWMYGPLYSNYWGSPYFFSPFGYSYLRLYPQYAIGGGLLPGGIFPAEVGGGVPSNRLPENGKAVNGQGYTRVYPRERGSATESGGGGDGRAGSTSSSRGTVSPRGYTAGDASSGGSSSSGSSSGGSSGGDGGGGRSAVPR